METHIRVEKKPSLTLADWANQNRRHLYLALGGLVAIIAVVAVWMIVSTSRNASAQAEFGKAMEIYSSPVVPAGTPVAPGVKTYTNNVDRAKAANSAFAAIADKYGMMEAGKNAKYMAAVTAGEAGQTATAEAQLKDLADSWNADRASMASLALAQLYQNTGRDTDAIAIYDKLTKKPSTVVPAGLAQLQLAGLYEAENKPVEAKKIYAALKDKEKDSTIGQMASQKLSGSQQ